MAKIVLTIQANNEATQSVKALNAEVRTLSKTLSSIKVNKDLTAQINALTKHYTTLVKAQEKVISNNNKQAISAEKLSQQQAITAKKVAEATAAQTRLEKAQQKTSTTTEQLQKKFANLLSTIKSIKNAYPEGTFDKIESGIRDNLQAAKDGAKGVADLSAAYETLSKDVAVTRAETDKVTTAVVKSGDSIGSLAKKFFLWQVTATLVMQPLRLIQNALSSINDTLVKTEDAVIALQRVLPSGSATDNEISSRLYKVAQDYGQTFENVSQIATNFARTGMSWADTIKATEAAVLALNVAELDAEEATTGLIAILSQFNLEASDLETVIDKLNKTADNFPVTTEKILAALQRTGSAASNANLSLDQTIALITALSQATGRSGENIGTALNSLIQYSSKASALDTFAGLSKESAEVVAQFRQGGATILDVWRQVSAEIKNLKSEQADLLDSYFATDDGEALKDALDGELQDIYTELGGVYDTANTFRKNYFIALLGNMDTVEQALGTLGDAAGYSQAENEKYLNTYTAKLNSLKAQWQDIANDEQGLLGIKKDLVDIGSFVLKIIDGIGGLKTALVALGVVVGTLLVTFKGEAIVAALTKMGTVIKALTIDAIPNLIATFQAWRGQTTLLNGQVVQLTGSTATFGQVVKAALPIISAVIIAISALDAALKRDAEERAEAEREAREEQDAAIAKSNERIDTQKKEVQSIEDVAASVENLRNVLDSSTASEEEKRTAQDKLLQIQNTLIESNNAYKDSLDLTNGALAEQLGLIEQLTTEQLKQKAQEFLAQKQSEIAIAQKRVGSQSTTKTNWLLSSSGYLHANEFHDILSQAITNAGVGNVASVIEDNTYTVYDNYFKTLKEGFKESFWKGLLASSGFTAMFDEASWVGEANAGFSFSGTIEEQLEAIKQLREYISIHGNELGLSDKQIISFTSELDSQYEALNDETYQQAQRLNEIAQATNDWLDGTITEEEYLEKVYGITRKTAVETENWHNNIAKVTEAYDDLIKALEKLRDEEKESLELEERKQAVLEAQKALEDARNEATVRRYNEATGQWEWQTDEKAIAEAEKNLKKARDELEKQAYETIIDQLENNTATNEGLNNLLDGLVSFLGDDFITAIKAAILGSTNVDLNKPVNETSNAESNPLESASSTTSKKPEAQDIHVLKNSDGSYATGKGIDKENIGDNGSVEWNGKKYRIENGGEVTDSELIALVKELGFPDRTIFTYKGSIYGVLDGGIVRLQARANSYGDKSKSGYKALSDAATSEFGSYDSGGIASGMGYMPKATNRHESVNDPDLTAKILSPVSNDQFHRYVRDMGLLFETSRQYAQAPVVERMGNTSDNRIDNSGQIIMNGVAIGSDQRSTSLDEILALGGIIPKV